jgi:formate hydrogenlyase subunit 3/multisubunit Na+/H+ antiporter MnhD subunit
METRKTLSKIVGLMQAVVGGISIVFAFLAFYNIFSIQTMLGTTGLDIGFYLWVFIIVGILSIISGLFLLYEQSRVGNHD